MLSIGTTAFGVADYTLYSTLFVDYLSFYKPKPQKIGFDETSGSMRLGKGRQLSRWDRETSGGRLTFERAQEVFFFTNREQPRGGGLLVCTFVHIIQLMDYQWDRNKAQANLRKHGVSFADATSVFEDDRAITIEDEHPSEDRFITIGMNALGQLLVVVYTWRGSQIRIISARHVTPRERRQYEENT